MKESSVDCKITISSLVKLKFSIVFICKADSHTEMLTI